MGFVAKDAVAQLDYDFDGLGVAALEGVRGTTPEPTQDQIRNMRFRLRELFNLGDVDDPAALQKRIAALTPDEIRERDEEMAEIYADACTQQPTTAEILALPHRVMSAYIGYLSEEFLTPTAGSSATKPSLAPRKNA